MKITRKFIALGLTALMGISLQSTLSAQDCPTCGKGAASHGGIIRGSAAAIHSGAGGMSGYHSHGEILNWASPSTWGDYYARNQAAQRPWHGEYYYLKTGQPTALIVPPTVVMQQNYSWGVSQNTMTPVYHQFGGGPASGGSGGQFRATPYWPSHTNQFGVYPVRGPWQ